MGSPRERCAAIIEMAGLAGKLRRGSYCPVSTPEAIIAPTCPRRRALNPFEAISFVLNDRRWIAKLAVAALWALLIPALVGWWLLYGWSVEVARRTLAGDAEPLPSWRKPGPLLRDGLRGCLTYLVYMLPFALLEAAAWALRTLVGGGLGNGLATALGLAAALWLLVASYWMVGVTLVLAQGGGLRQTLALGGVRALLRDNATPYQLAHISIVLLAPLLTLGGALFLGIGALVGIGWSFALSGRLYAQAYIQAND